MQKISVFNFVSVDGAFAGPNGEIDWFKTDKQDPDFDAYIGPKASGGGTLIWGHTTYEMMKQRWPTPAAIQSDPKMAAAVNDSPKVVFSKTLTNAHEVPNWKDVMLFSDVRKEDILKLKQQEGKGMTILGSGSIVQQFANLDLIDEYTLVVMPIVLGNGKPLFKDVKKTKMQLLESLSFKNGIVILRYAPAK